MGQPIAMDGATASPDTAVPKEGKSVHIFATRSDGIYPYCNVGEDPATMFFLFIYIPIRPKTAWRESGRRDRYG